MRDDNTSEALEDEWPGNELHKGAHNALQALKHNETEVLLIGRNDDVEVEFRLIEMPPVALNVRPVDLYVNGEHVWHEAAESEDGIILSEGEFRALGDFCSIEDIEVVNEGPGPAAMTLRLFNRKPDE